MGRVTAYVLRHYLGMGHCLVCDNRFTSATLFQYLYEHHSTTAVGSLRQNSAELPPDRQSALAKTDERGRFCLRQSGRLVFTAWKDTKTVWVLSTDVDPVHEPAGEVRRRTRGGEKRVQCPATVLAYQHGFNGVDKSNHLVSSSYVGRRSRCWHRYLFFRKLNQALVNARINMLSAVGGGTTKTISQTTFRRALASQLLSLAEGGGWASTAGGAKAAVRVHKLERAPRFRRLIRRALDEFKRQRYFVSLDLDGARCACARTANGTRAAGGAPHARPTCAGRLRAATASPDTESRETYVSRDSKTTKKKGKKERQQFDFSFRLFVVNK